eukprot:421943-Alexandrium_andersonii.AAC.1
MARTTASAAAARLRCQRYVPRKADMVLLCGEHHHGKGWALTGGAGAENSYSARCAPAANATGLRPMPKYAEQYIEPRGSS